MIIFCSILSRSGSLYPATAMAPLRRRRFLECDDLEAKRAEEENVIKEYGVKLSDEGVHLFVSIFSAHHSETLPCDDLVLAAGPWTPRLFRELFPSANLDFHETTQLWKLDRC